MKDKEIENMQRELLKLQNEVVNKNIELERFQSSMNHEKMNFTSRQEKIINQWKDKYEKVILYINW